LLDKAHIYKLNAKSYRLGTIQIKLFLYFLEYPKLLTIHSHRNYSSSVVHIKYLAAIPFATLSANMIILLRCSGFPTLIPHAFSAKPLAKVKAHGRYITHGSFLSSGVTSSFNSGKVFYRVAHGINSFSATSTTSSGFISNLYPPPISISLTLIFRAFRPLFLHTSSSISSAIDILYTGGKRTVA